MNGEENNKLIAEFMGLEQAFAHKKDEHGYIQTVDGYKINHGIYSIDKLQYRTSWDWLMPCLDKMKKLCMPEHRDRLEKFINDVLGSLQHTDIEHTYKWFVIFIKWYNSQTNQK